MMRVRFPLPALKNRSSNHLSPVKSVVVGSSPTCSAKHFDQVWHPLYAGSKERIRVFSGAVAQSVEHVRYAILFNPYCCLDDSPTIRAQVLGSIPRECRGSNPQIRADVFCSRRLAVRTLAFHVSNASSNLVGNANNSQLLLEPTQ